MQKNSHASSLKKQQPSIGGFLQCFKQPVSTIETVRSFRQAYPRTSLYIVCDEGYHYDGLAQYFHAQYDYAQRIGQDIGIVANNRGVMITWMQRFIDAARQMSEDYVMILEDDVRIFKPATNLQYDLNGINPEMNIGVAMTRELKRRGAKIPADCDNYYFGGCGGCIIQRDFLVNKIGTLNLEQVIQELEPFLDEHLKRHYVSDYWLSLLILLQGGTIGNYDGFCETWHADYWVRKHITHSIETLHFDKSLHSTPLSNLDLEILGGWFTDSDITDYENRRSAVNAVPKSVGQKIIEVIVSPRKWIMWATRKFKAYRRLQLIKKKIVSGAYDIIIVGAGISGLTLAERYASIGKSVLVIEARDHIGGNCYDYVNDDGILVSKYGPHYFRTNYDEVRSYVEQFTSWRPYEARIVAHVQGKKVPVPVNITTVNMLFGTQLETEDDMLRWIEENREPIEHPRNAEEAVVARMGRKLYDALFKDYTIKQWGKHPRELDPEVTNRIPIRSNTDDRYFSDAFQALPRDGYTKLFENMAQHPLISLRLNASWDTVRNSVHYREKLFFTGKIDHYFSEMFGKLEYRSLRFEHETLDQEYFQDYAQENHPSSEVPFTRIVEYKHVTGQQHPKTTIVREYPTWDGEPYYPVPSSRNHELFAKYQDEAKRLEKDGIYFVGRLANYKYFNMDQAFKNALDLFHRLEGK